MDDPKKGWHSRGYLPHYDGNVSQFITFRLFDSLPQGILKTLEIEAKANKLAHFYGEERRKRIEEYLDRGIGECFLRRREIGSIVEQALFYLAGTSITLFSWVIMPNHAHILVRPSVTVSLSSVMRSLKGFTSYEANKLLGRTGRFWQPDYFDRYIRNARHFSKVVEYIEN